MESKRLQTEVIRVMHLRSTPFLGSPERLILGRLKEMDSKECEYFVGIFDEQRNGTNDFYKMLQTLKVNSFVLFDSMTFFIPNLMRLLKKTYEFLPQIICTHDPKANFYGLWVSKVFKIPIVSAFHGRTEPDFKGKVYQKFDNKILKWFDGMICVSKKTGEMVRKIVPGIHVQIIPNAVDIEEIRCLSEQANGDDLWPRNRDQKTIVFAGRLSKEKGLPYLIESAEIILKKNRDIKFLIIGKGPEDGPLRQIIEKKRLEEHIQLLGFKRNIYPYIKSAEFLVLPSLIEGMPVVILEALALAKPVIATNVGGIPEVIENGFNGLLVNPKDVSELAKAMEHLLADRKRANEMGQNGYSLVSEKFNFDIQYKQYLKFYKTIIEENKRLSS